MNFTRRQWLIYWSVIVTGALIYGGLSALIYSLSR